MLQKKYNDFLYLYDNIGGYHIVYKDGIQRSQTFYKYYALTNYNVEALTNMYLYFLSQIPGFKLEIRHFRTKFDRF